MIIRSIISYLLVASAVLCPLTETLHACAGDPGCRHGVKSHDDTHEHQRQEPAADPHGHSHAACQQSQELTCQDEQPAPLPTKSDSDCGHDCFCSGAVLSALANSSTTTNWELAIDSRLFFVQAIDSHIVSARRGPDDLQYQGAHFPPRLSGILIRSLIDSRLL